MTQTVKSVAIRLSTDGKEGVQSDYADIGAAGKAAGVAAAEGSDQAAAASARQTAAFQRQANAAKAAYAASSSQSGINALLGVSAGSLNSAQASAAAFKELMDGADELRAKIDPLGAAQNTLSLATQKSNSLLEAGAITAVEHAAALKLAQTEYDAAAKSLAAMGAGTTFSTMQMQELSAVAHRTFDSLAAGMPVSRVVTMEGGRLGAAFASGEGGVGGALKLVGSAATSTWGLLGIGATVMAGLVISALAYADSQKKIEQAVLGAGAASGVSLGQINALAQAQAQSANISVGAALKLETQLVSTGRANEQSLSESGAALKALMALSGDDAKTATAALVSLFEDPARGAADLATKYDILSGSQLDQIKSLELQGDRAGALKLAMDGLISSGQDLERPLSALAVLGHGIGDAFSFATTKVGEFIAKELGIQSADPATRLKTLQDQLTNTLYGTPSDTDGINRLYAQIQAAQDALAKNQQKQDSARQNQRSMDVQHLVDSASPAIAKMRELTERRQGLVNIQNDPTQLAGSGRSAQDVQTSIAATDKEIADLKKRTTAHDAHADSLKRELAAMQANAAGSLLMAQGYLQSDAAGAKAEATRKAVTDATKKGGDIAAFVTAQLQEQAAQEAATAGKTIAGMRDELAARQSLNDQVAAGTLTSEQADKQLALETQLRPLVTAMTYADAATKKVLAQEITALTQAMNAGNTAQATSNFLRQQAQDDETLAELKLQIAMVGDLTGQREKLLAVMKAEDAAKKAGMSSDEIQRRGQSAATQSAAETDLRHSQFLTSTSRGQSDNLALSQQELVLIGKTQDAHDAIIDRLKMEQTLKGQGIDLSAKDAQDILAQVAATDALNAKIRSVGTAWAEVKSAGDTFVDDVLNPQNWTSFGDWGKKILQDIGTELEKLALINPLKNWLFGESNATLGGAAGVLGLLGKGGSAAIPDDGFLSSLAGTLPGFASGTPYAPGGAANIDEKGGEIVNLPRGASVMNHGQSVDLVSQAAQQTLQNMQRVADASSGGMTFQTPINVTIDARGSTSDSVQTLSARMDDFERGLPGKIVSTVNDQYQRRSIMVGRRR